MKAPAITSYPALAAALTARREALDLSPADVDALADLPPSTTRRIETGRIMFSPRTLGPILAVLGARLIVQAVARAA